MKNKSLISIACKNTAKGMTILEVLVAVALFSIVAVAIAGYMATYSSAPIKIQKKQTAALVADAVMVQHSLNLLDSVKGTMQQGKYTFTYEIHKKPSKIQGFEMVFITIRDKDKQKIGTLSRLSKLVIF